MKIAVISDTHGLLRPELLPALTGVDHILHAGDIGNADFLATLRSLAPLTAIRGNIDIHGPCADLPATEVLERNGHLLYMLHNLRDLDLKPEAAGIGVVISGHTHQPVIATRNGVLYLNPGSCGPRRFSLPVTIALLNLTGKTPTAEIISLLPNP